MDAEDPFSGGLNGINKGACIPGMANKKNYLRKNEGKVEAVFGKEESAAEQLNGKELNSGKCPYIF